MFMKFADEAKLEVLEFDIRRELGDFQSWWWWNMVKQCKLLRDLQKATKTFC